MGLRYGKTDSFTSYAGITRIRFKGQRTVSVLHLSRSPLQRPCVQLSAVKLIIEKAETFVKPLLRRIFAGSATRNGRRDQSPWYLPRHLPET